MIGVLFVKLMLIALAASTLVAVSAADRLKEREGGCHEGDRKCYGRDKASPYYYRCANNEWKLYTCGNGYTCGGSGSDTKCVSDSAPPPQPTCQNGQRRCIGSSNPNLYYFCSEGSWKLYSCGNGYQCKQTSPLQAACTSTAPQCASGAQRCVADGSSGSFYSCVDGQWKLKSCSPGDRCINIPGNLVNCQVGGGGSKDPITSQWYGQASHETHPELIQETETTYGIDAAEYEARRQSLVRDLPSGSTAIVFSASMLFIAPHVFHQFRQDSDFYYLTGWNEPNSIAVIEKSEHTSRGYILTMFVSDKDPEKELWEGPRNGVEAAVSLFGADEARPIGEFKRYAEKLAKTLDKQGPDGNLIYTDLDADFDIQRSTHCKVLKELLRQKNLGARTHRLTSKIQQLRLIKSQAEIELMREAGRISTLAFIKIMRECRPGMSEAELQAIFEHECKTALRSNDSGGGDRSRSSSSSSMNQAVLTRPAYVPVFASGEHALCMHYVQNSGIMKGGDLILVDAGAEFASYASDITRTFPVSGRFSDAQRDLYNAVLSVQQQMVRLCHAESEYSLNEIQHRSTRVLKEELKQIGFDASERDISNRLYPHHIAHYLGIDVHDTMDLTRSQRLKPNMVVTIEPGIYVPYDSKFPKAFQGIGIRIEDDVVVGRTLNDIENLSASCPKTTEDIEACMHKR
ncbi:aminopeptidase [Coemansia sp. RSA 1939]|nr:aminopeptidase [Coemansia sp. RSA 1939]